MTTADAVIRFLIDHSVDKPCTSVEMRERQGHKEAPPLNLPLSKVDEPTTG